MKTYPAPEHVDRVTLRSEEVTTMCPITGNPDFYTVEISYEPSERVLCTKALKEWFTSQREEGYSCETFCREVFNLALAELEPRSLYVRIRQVPRGGIGIVAEAST